MDRLQGNYLLSPVCDVVWCGWRTTTLALQQAGWGVAMEKRGYDFETRMLLSHRGLRLSGVSAPVDLGQFTRMDSRPPAFHIVHMASDLRLRLDSSEFRQIDASPQWQVALDTSREIDAFSIFATPLARTEEIIVEPQDVSAMLEQIRRMQAPVAKEIRQRERRREGEAGQREVFHAQILSLAA